jgi:hypothetical protein
MFSYSKIMQVQLLGTSHASLLTWFVHPSLAKPDVMNNTRVTQLAADINTILSRSAYSQISYGTTGATAGGAKEQLLRAIAPNCTQLILQCTFGKQIMSGWDCCSRVFDPNPYFTQAGDWSFRNFFTFIAI